MNCTRFTFYVIKLDFCFLFLKFFTLGSREHKKKIKLIFFFCTGNIDFFNFPDCVLAIDFCVNGWLFYLSQNNAPFPNASRLVCRGAISPFQSLKKSKWNSENRTSLGRRMHCYGVCFSTTIRDGVPIKQNASKGNWWRMLKTPYDKGYHILKSE